MPGVYFPGLALDRFVDETEEIDLCFLIPFVAVPFTLCDEPDEERPCGIDGSVRSLRSVMFFSSLSALSLRRLAHCRRGWF